MSAIEVDRLSHVYAGAEGGVPALQDISLKVEAGKFVVIVGPSGCGKTSLLMMLAGVLMIAAIAIAFNELVRWVETRCSHWRT